MKARFFASLLLSGACLMSPAPAAEQKASPAPAYQAKVDPAAFRPVLLEHKKLGVTTSPATVRLITPGMDKFSIYPLIGPPHFGETVKRRWNYVLFFPPATGETERMRCRVEIRFQRLRDHYDVIVSDVVWQDQACADRVAHAS